MSTKNYSTFTLTLDDGTVKEYAVCTYLADGIDHDDTSGWDDKKEKDKKKKEDNDAK